MIKYTVIVPAYNSGNTIQSCIEALLRQSIDKKAYEIITVDDGSTDGTGDIVKKFPVRYIPQQNRGPAAARNHGAKEASGEIILFTDSDRVPSADWIEEMVKPFKNQDVIAVKGAYRTSQRSLTALKDSYTPQTLKLQILFLYLFLLCVIPCVLMPKVMLYPAVMSLAAFCFSLLPFMSLAAKNDLAVCILSPFFISLRAASLGLGIIWGLTRWKKMR